MEVCNGGFKTSGASIRVVPLGAGQDVGRSCVLVSIGGKNIMFDCGMHMGYNDARRFPDFSFVSQSGNFTQALSAVIITHFHLDHCGALAYFTEMKGYDGPVYMSHPTKAIVPILLEDYRKITVERKGEDQRNFFTSQMIKDCMKKVICVRLHQTVRTDDGEIEITPYYAGHVLGACMFHVRVGQESVLYTGDYNMTPDRHLGAAQVEKIRPTLLITETTYATTIRDSKRTRERDFLKRVHECVERGGKVLIPVFALGRAQELCILLDTYWQRMGLRVPIFFSAGLTEKSLAYYKHFVSWTSQSVKATHVKANAFDFKHITTFDRDDFQKPGACVLFATPGMLHAGMSLEAFKYWAPDPKNLLIIPGYCVVGTVGSRMTSGFKGPVEIDGRNTVDVQCEIAHVSFSAHADAKGIMQLLRQAEPENVLLVHGEKWKMGFLREKITREFGVPCYDPANGQYVTVQSQRKVPVRMSTSLLQQAMQTQQKARLEGHGFDPNTDDDAASPPPEEKRAKLDRVPVSGVLLMRVDQVAHLMSSAEAAEEARIPPHFLTLAAEVCLKGGDAGAALRGIQAHCGLEGLACVEEKGGALRVESVCVSESAKHPPGTALHFTWAYEDAGLAQGLLDRAVSAL